MKNTFIFRIPAVLTMILLCCLNAFSQAHFEGIVEYGLEIESKDISPEMASMVPKEFTLYMKDEQSRLEISTGMSDITVLGDNAAGSAITLMNVMGSKFAVKTDSAQINEALEKLGEYQIVHVDGTKEILGYDCKKALVVRKASDDTSRVWYTRQLPPIYAAANQFLPKGNWFPMEVHGRQNGADVTITVREIKEVPVEAALFEIPAGYKVVDQNKIRQALSGQ